MSALRAAAQAAERRELALAGGDTDAVLRIVGAMVWRYARVHWDEPLLRRKVLIITLTLRVKDVAPFLAVLFGPEPAPAVVG